ncbi:guanine deaminase [Pseudenhygromyxa sp. WMMC2535]|nr:guanine deaminase [Pseudenhygromyxa sp. WMMC2535]NVB40806.1 guanine deaminase [Pseudenhygromyxa sp. WMMC2535]
MSPVGPREIDYWEDGVVVVEDQWITEVGPYDGLPIDEDLRPGLLTPGFVDGHVHFPQARIVGAASGPLLRWLERSVFPEEARFADVEYASAVAREFCDALARAGTTLALIYGSVHAEACQCLLEELDRRGLRAIVGPVLMDQGAPPELLRPKERALADLAALEERWRDHPRLKIAVIPRFALSCSEEMMRAAAALASERGLWVSTHISENLEECQLTRDRFSAPDYLEVYERVGLIHERTVLAHCIHLSAGEWDRVAGAGSVVAHCPDSNAFLGSGSMPIAEALSREVPLTLGSDVAAGRSLRIPTAMAYAHDNGLRTNERLDPRQLLWWGTRGGAQALGHDQVGALRVGMVADMVLHALPERIQGEEAVLASLLFDGDRPAPLRTWVGGREL